MHVQCMHARSCALGSTAARQRAASLPDPPEGRHCRTPAEIVLWTKAQMLHGRWRCGQGELASRHLDSPQTLSECFLIHRHSNPFQGKLRTTDRHHEI